MAVSGAGQSLKVYPPQAGPTADAHSKGYTSPTNLNLFEPAQLGNLQSSFPEKYRADSAHVHDGRFKTLEKVIEYYNSGMQDHPNLGDALKDDDGQPIRLNFTEQEKTDLVNFLKTLTDGILTNDVKFSNSV